jgi:hypothetical protein
MWIVVILSGLLVSSQGIDAGYSEMNDMKPKFATKAECEKARPHIEDAVIGNMREHFGADKVIAVGVCWDSSTAGDPA